jgi:hypothetical protein
MMNNPDSCDNAVQNPEEACSCGCNCNTASSISSSPDNLIEPEYPLSFPDFAMRPFKKRDALNKILIGGLISLVPVIGQIIISGYLIGYIKKIINRKDSWTLPGFDNWQETFAPGLAVFIGWIFYAIGFLAISTVVAVPFWGGVVVSIDKIKNTNNPAAIMAVISAILIPLLIICALLFLFALVIPVMMILYAKSDRFTDLFNFGAAYRLIFSNFMDYVVTVGVTFLTWMIFGMIVGVLGGIPILGTFILAPIGGAIFGFGMNLVVYSAFAEFYYKNHQDAGL